jgi:hypothetical protein
MEEDQASSVVEKKKIIKHLKEWKEKKHEDIHYFNVKVGIK